MAVVQDDRSVEAPAAPQQQGSTSQQTARLYHTIWRWHFYAGVFVAPVILVAATTGALYVFRAELEPLLYQSLIVVEPEMESTKLSFDQQWKAAEGQVPEGSRLLFAQIPPLASESTDRATLFRYMMPGGEDQRFVYVHPYSGAVTGFVDRSWQFFEVVLKIHRQLYAGTTGRTLIELATSWGIILVFTGVYLWWPKQNWSQAAGVWLPRLKSKQYTVLRDLHAVPAVYMSILMLLVLGTGLFFTNVWGKAYRFTALQTGGFPETFLDPPKSQPPDDDSTEAITIDEALSVARNNGFDQKKLIVTPPREAEDSYTISERGETGPSVSGMLYIDQYSADILHVTRGDDIPMMTVALLYALPIHQGSIFGLPTKILAFLVALTLMVSAITGAWMWWVRRPKGTAGLPRRYEDVSVPRWIGVLILVLSIFLPVVGISLIVVLIADWFWVRWNRWRLGQTA